MVLTDVGKDRKSILREFLHGVGEDAHLPPDLPHILQNLLLGVQVLYALGVGVIAGNKRPGDGVGEFPHFPLCILEAVGDIVDGLILCDWVLLITGDGRLKLTDLRFSGQTVFELAERGEQAGPVRLDLPVLPANSKLDGEPVTGGQFLDVVIAGPEGGEADFLGELGKCRIGKEGHVTNQLVTHVGLGSVQRSRRVTDVLSGVEYTESQTGQEVSG